VHQSAKDFLLANALSGVFPMEINNAHQSMFSKSLAILSRTLHRDMYGLKALGTTVKNVQPPEPNPLAKSCYSCVYWIDHLLDSQLTPLIGSFADAEVKAVDVFLRKKYFYWLEELSLCMSLGQGVVSMTKLWLILQV
jgi:hypothetical protein